MALEYFEPAITDSEEDPEWLEKDWTEFIRTLRTQFGPLDPTGDAESRLDHLKMRDNQHLIKYNIEFNRLSICTNWNDVAMLFSDTAIIPVLRNESRTLWDNKGNPPPSKP